MHNELIKVKLPKAFSKTFRSKNRSISPYYKFYCWAIQQVPKSNVLEIAELLYGKNDKQAHMPNRFMINVTAFRLCKKDREKLNNLVLQWLKYSTDNFYADRAYTTMLQYEDFATGPSNAENTEEGYVYVEPIWWTTEDKYGRKK